MTAGGVLRTIGWNDNGDGSFTIGFTAPGDSNLDGQLDILDAANFLNGGRFDAGGNATWSTGDFNYDGAVDILDVADFLVGGNFDAGPLPSAPAAAAVATAAITATANDFSNADLAFAALAQGQTSQSSPRKKNVFATL
jgi:hypothetical protein